MYNFFFFFWRYKYIFSTLILILFVMIYFRILRICLNEFENLEYNLGILCEL